MFHIEVKLICSHTGCGESVSVTLGLYKGRVFDGAGSDTYPVFMEVIDPPKGWTISEGKYGESSCPIHSKRK